MRKIWQNMSFCSPVFTRIYDSVLIRGNTPDSGIFYTVYPVTLSLDFRKIWYEAEGNPHSHPFPLSLNRDKFQLRNICLTLLKRSCCIYFD